MAEPISTPSEQLVGNVPPIEPYFIAPPNIEPVIEHVKQSTSEVVVADVPSLEIGLDHSELSLQPEVSSQAESVADMVLLAPVHDLTDGASLIGGLESSAAIVTTLKEIDALVADIDVARSQIRSSKVDPGNFAALWHAEHGAA
jgi:hypothetical protein